MADVCSKGISIVTGQVSLMPQTAVIEDTDLSWNNRGGWYTGSFFIPLIKQGTMEVEELY